MKKTTMMKVLSLACVATLALGTLVGCGDSADKTMKVGVIQYATHASLDDCYNGLVEGLATAGYVDGENITIDLQNPQGDMSNGDLMAKNMVSDGYDMVIGIATPAAMSAYAAARNTDIPVVFTAVSDPVAAQLVQSLEAPGMNCTGTADVLDLDAQMALIRACLPDATKVGIIYTTSEPNSVSTLANLETIAPNYGFEVVAQGVASGAEVATAAASLVSKGVDCINNFTDNNVVDNLAAILNVTSDAGIPVFGSEVQQVIAGCLASESIDYVAMGQNTGAMAAKILSGDAKASDMAVNATSDCAPVINSDVANVLGIAIPADYASADDVAGEG